METNHTFGNFYLEYSIIDNLKAKINLGSDRQSARRDEYVTKNDTRKGQTVNGVAYVNQQNRSNYLAEFTMTYDKNIKETHHVNALLGATYQEFNNNNVYASSSDFPTDAFLTNNLSAGNSTMYNIGTGKNKNQLLSYLARVNYSLHNKYLATVSFRVDGSSRFGADHKYGYFPSAALAWRISEEKFMKNIDFLSDLKLRGSYGVTGNQEIGNYKSLVLLSTSGEAIFNDNPYISIAPTKLGNSNLRWETTAQYDFGFDFGLFANRISGTFDYFYKNTYDLLLNVPISLTTGFDSSVQNVGDTKNYGFDFSITSRNLTGNLAWSTTFIGSSVKNKATNLGPVDRILSGNVRFLKEFAIIQEGQLLNSYFGYQVEGIFQNEEEIAASAQPSASPGDLRIKDTNGDGSINPEDRTVIGNPVPDFTFGVNNTLSYKRFDLNFFFEGILGNEILNVQRANSDNPLEDTRNRMSYVLDRWMPDNTDSENPSFISTSTAYSVNSRLIEDASFLRLKTLKLSYTVPSKRIRSLLIFATIQNLFTITNYSGYDPDVNALGNRDIKADLSAYPLSRVYTVGLKLGL